MLISFTSEDISREEVFFIILLYITKGTREIQKLAVYEVKQTEKKKANYSVKKITFLSSFHISFLKIAPLLKNMYQKIQMHVFLSCLWFIWNR